MQMQLSDFPRPAKDNSRGVHWGTSLHSPGKKEWAFWREQLLAMGIKWVKIMDDGGALGSGLRICERLIDIGIMPVVRFYRAQQNPGTIGQRGREAVARYVQRGVVYFETNNEPDLDLEWRYPKPPEWLDIVVDDFIRDADIVLEKGGYPAVPAFGVGTQRDPFAKIVERGRRDILDGGAWAAIHDYCLGRPLEYPNDEVNLYGRPITQAEWEAGGGEWAWEMPPEHVNEARAALKRPDATIMTDATCFRGYEALDALVRQAVGHSIPVMMTEGGYNVGQRAGTTYGDDPRYPKPTPLAMSRMTMDMFRFLDGSAHLLNQDAPGYLFALMPWLIGCQVFGEGAPQTENQGPWFTHQFDRQFGLDGELPIVQMLKNEPGRVRANGPVPAQWAKPPWEIEPGLEWDFRLKYLGVQRESVCGVEGPYWKLVKAQWYDEDEVAGAAGYVFVQALDVDGAPIQDARFLVERPAARDTVVTKGPIDGYWGDYAMRAFLGTYSVRMEQGGFPSEAVVGLGLGLEDDPRVWARTAFRLVFRLTNA